MFSIFLYICLIFVLCVVGFIGLVYIIRYISSKIILRILIKGQCKFIECLVDNELITKGMAPEEVNLIISKNYSYGCMCKTINKNEYGKVTEYACLYSDTILLIYFKNNMVDEIYRIPHERG